MIAAVGTYDANDIAWRVLHRMGLMGALRSFQGQRLNIQTAFGESEEAWSRLERVAFAETQILNLESLGRPAAGSEPRPS